ncbi:MAG TPA: hypothetical protein VN969_14045 [Streptosporangiaceae bacterium]|nr:hypothetical protein [Streptosporangiaceae bacterium]
MPVSRGRKAKKSKKRPQRTVVVRRAEPDAVFSKVSGSPLAELADVLESLLGQGDVPEWWGQSQERLIDASRGLLAATSPRTLEQAAAELIGGELYTAVTEGHSGLRFEVWANELTDRLVSRIRDTADNGDWQGPWWLLQGLASIGSDGLGGWAEEQAAKAAVSLPAGWQASQPAWLTSMTEIRATGDVRAMRDTYGTRFGVIAEFRYPEGTGPFWYLFDIDVSGFFVLAGAGVFDEADQAAEAWRDAVGISAEGLTPAPLTPDVLTCLTYFGSEERYTDGDESRMLLDNWFRAPRRISDLIRALAKRGVALPPYRSLHEDIDSGPMADEFTAWYSERHGRPLDDEVAEALASEWLEGIMPGTEHAVSPGRSAYYRRLVSTDWLDDPVTAQVLAVLPEWVRWHGEQSGLPAHLLDIAVKAAQADSASLATEE